MFTNVLHSMCLCIIIMRLTVYPGHSFTLCEYNDFDGKIIKDMCQEERDKICNSVASQLNRGPGYTSSLVDSKIWYEGSQVPDKTVGEKVSCCTNCKRDFFYYGKGQSDGDVYLYSLILNGQNDDNLINIEPVRNIPGPL